MQVAWQQLGPVSQCGSSAREAPSLTAGAACGMYFTASRRAARPSTGDRLLMQANVGAGFRSTSGSSDKLSLRGCLSEQPR